MSIDINRLRRILAQEGLTKTAGSGDLNAKYLASIPAPMKAKILKAVANHYGVSISEIEEEVTDKDAEALYEYIPTRSMAVQVLRDMKGKRFASYDSDPGDVYASAYESAEEALSDMETALESSGWRTQSKDPEFEDGNRFFGEIKGQKGRDKITAKDQEEAATAECPSSLDEKDDSNAPAAAAAMQPSLSLHDSNIVRQQDLGLGGEGGRNGETSSRDGVNA